MFSLRLLRQATHRVPKCASSLLSDVFNESSIDRHSNLVPVWPITSLAISPDTFGDVFSASGATLHAYTNNGVFLCGTRLNQGKFAPEQTGISAVEQTNAEILTLAVTKQSHENLLLCGHVDGAIRIVALQVNAQRSTDSVHFVHKHTLHPSAVFRQSNSSIDNDMPVCALHTSHTAVDSFWSADAAGRVLRWTVQPFAKHWVPRSVFTIGSLFS
jgi:hypothetical protein